MMTGSPNPVSDLSEMTVCLNPQDQLRNDKRKGIRIQRITSVQFSPSVVSDSLRPHESKAHQASLSITNSRSSLRLTSIESVMPSSHLILCRPLLLLPLIFFSIRVFSNESALLIRWPKYWSFSYHSFQRNPRADLL